MCAFATVDPPPPVPYAGTSVHRRLQAIPRTELAAGAHTDAANPCAGVKGHKETGRDRYVTDEEFRAVWECAHFTVQDAMDLAYYTAQRHGDVLRFKRSDIRAVDGIKTTSA